MTGDDLPCAVDVIAHVFFLMGTPFVGFSVLLISCDRCYAVFLPASYYKSDYKRAWIAVIGEY